MSCQYYIIFVSTSNMASPIVKTCNSSDLNLNFNQLSLISQLYFCVDKFNNWKGLSIIHLNARSIINKMDKISIFCNLYKPKFLCVSESWLKKCDSKVLIEINNYRIHRKDRCDGRMGGGVIIQHVIYFKPNFSLKLKLQ